MLEKAKKYFAFRSLNRLCRFAAKVGFGSEKQKNFVLFCFSLTLHYLCDSIAKVLTLEKAK